MYKQGDDCPLCGAGQLCEKVVEECFSYKGYSLTVPDYRVLECPACGEAVVDKDSARRAEKLLRDFGRQVDGLLTAADIKRIRRSLHLTQEQMATVLGGGLKGFARYENGQVVQSRAMDNLLRILDRFPESLNVLPGVQRPQAVTSPKRKRIEAGMVCEGEFEYERLTRAAQANSSVHSHTVMEWFALPSSGASTKDEIDQQLNAERDSWDRA